VHVVNGKCLQNIGPEMSWKRQRGRVGNNWEKNIKMDLRGRGREDRN
jgi:hypothetical protein